MPSVLVAANSSWVEADHGGWLPWRRADRLRRQPLPAWHPRREVWMAQAPGRSAGLFSGDEVLATA